MVDWNGGAAPDTIGSRWMPGSSGTKVLSTPYQSVGWRFTAEATETVNTMLVPVSQIDVDGLWMLEIYESGGEVTAATPTTETFRPNSDEFTGNWLNQAASGTNIYQSVDGSTFDPASYVYFNGSFIPGVALRFGYNTATWSSGRRVTGMRLNVVAANTGGTAIFGGSLEIGGVEYTFGGTASVGSEVQTVAFTLGELNPATGLPWTQDDITELDTAGDCVGLVAAFGSSVTGLLVYQMWLEIDYVPETRVAVSRRTIATDDATGWVDWVTIVDPNDTAITDWDKVDGTEYVITLRNLGNADEFYNGTIRLPWLDSGEPLPTGWEQAFLPVDANGLISVPFEDFATTRAIGLLFSVSDVGDSPDGQPWSQFDGYLDLATEQQITTTSGATYGRIKFGWLDTTDLTGITPPSTDLTVAVKRQSDDVQFGSTETFTVAQLQAGTLIGTAQADPQGVDATAPLYLIERDLTTPAVLGTTQYYVEFTGDGHAIAVAQPPDSSTVTVDSFTDANISEPWYICEGPDGNLWFTSAANNRIGRITTAGVITTYTSASFNFPVGICAGPDGNLWVASFGNQSIVKVNTSGTVLNTYTSVGNLGGVYGICAGPDGNLWATSSSSDKICKVTTAGVVTPYTDAALDGPNGICAGPDGNLWFVCNDTPGAVGKITTAGTITMYVSASLNGCVGICSGPDGNLWITSQLNNRVAKVTTGGSITVYADASIDEPFGIMSDGSVLWFTSSGNGRVSKLTTSGQVTAYSDADIVTPYGICHGPDSNVWFVDNTDDSVSTIVIGSSVGGPATFDGVTDAATIGGLRVDSDYPVTLIDIPDAPTDFAAAVEDQELTTANGTSCGTDVIDRVVLTWTPTVLGSSFGSYEIQRDDGWGFQTIAVITDESVEEARDVESIRGSVSYRMRVCRSTDDECSDWTATETVVREGIPGDPDSPIWLFTSNAAPEMSCAYNVTDTQTYGWPDAPAQRVINHYGTDNKTRYVETERRLTEFELPLTVYAASPTSDPTTNQGVAPFFPLLELCSQTSAPLAGKTVLPYVAVIDPHGNSWFAAVTVPAGTVRVAESNAHVCTAQVVELTQEPCTFDLEGGS